jgi:hypothetical protein
MTKPKNKSWNMTSSPSTFSKSTKKNNMLKAPPKVFNIDQPLSYYIESKLSLSNVTTIEDTKAAPTTPA